MPLVPNSDPVGNQPAHAAWRSHFVDFEGDLDCRISSTDLYIPPSQDPMIMKKKLPFCKNRQSLLDALNGGGRHGFDEPFVPRGSLLTDPRLMSDDSFSQAATINGTRLRKSA